MDLQERLAREGKIAQLKKEMLALTVRIRNKQNTIRWAVSPTHTLADLENYVESLQVAVAEYAGAWSEYREAQEHLRRLQEE
jgi:hypothetical protein